jgi:hypothetical protein
MQHIALLITSGRRNNEHWKARLFGGLVFDAACGKCYRSTGCVTSERKWQTLTHKHFANYYVLWMSYPFPAPPQPVHIHLSQTCADRHLALTQNSVVSRPDRAVTTPDIQPSANRVQTELQRRHLEAVRATMTKMIERKQKMTKKNTRMRSQAVGDMEDDNYGWLIPVPFNGNVKRTHYQCRIIRRLLAATAQLV